MVASLITYDHPVELMSGGEVSRRLSVAPRERLKLDACQLITARGTAGGATLYPAEQVEHLANLPPARITTPAIAVRLGIPQSADDESPQLRKWRGWSERWDTSTKADAARMWWRVADPDALIGGTLIATVAHFVVGSWIITGATVESGQVRFDIKQPIQDDLRLTVLRLGPGALVKSWR